MILLAIECSSKTASAAIFESGADAPDSAPSGSGALLGQVFLNAGLTHSETLLPMISQLLEQTRVSAGRLEALAITNGPGSFTGLRIGISTVLGLAWARALPCLGVSSLEAAAWNVAHMGKPICSVMDARRGRVYRALFTADSGACPPRPARLTDDRAVPLETLFDELRGDSILVGDGAFMCYNAFGDTLPVTLAPEHLRYPTGCGTALAALAAGPSAFHGADTLRAAYCSGAEKYQYSPKNKGERTYERRNDS